MTTSGVNLFGKRILVVEDDWFIAKGLARGLRTAGAQVVGPVPSIHDALTLLEAEPLDAAVLDVKLRGEMAYPVADALAERNVPFVFSTGYSPEALPARYAGVACCDKLDDAGAIVRALFPG